MSKKLKAHSIKWVYKVCLLILILYISFLILLSSSKISPNVRTVIEVNRPEQNYSNCVGQAKSPVVLVLGMHHTATSLVSHGLIYMGLYAGETNDILLANPKVSIQNNSKFFEQRAIVEYNDQIYNNLSETIDVKLISGMPKWLGAGIDINAIKPAERANFVRGAMPVINYFCNGNNFQQHRGIVLKDPRMPITLPIWVEALKDFDVACVITYRDPYQVYASLIKWVPTGLESFQAVTRIWEATYRNSVDHCNPQNTVIILQKDLLADIKKEFYLLKSIFSSRSFLCLLDPSDEFIDKSSKTSRDDYILPKPKLLPSQYEITSKFTGLPFTESIGYRGVFAMVLSCAADDCRLNVVTKMAIESILSHYPFSSLFILAPLSSIDSVDSLSEYVNVMTILGYDVQAVDIRPIMNKYARCDYDKYPLLSKIAAVVHLSQLYPSLSITVVGSDSILKGPIQHDVLSIEFNREISDSSVSFHIPYRLMSHFSDEFSLVLKECQSLKMPFTEPDIADAVLQLFGQTSNSYYAHDNIPIELQLAAFKGDKNSLAKISDIFKNNSTSPFIQLHSSLLRQYVDEGGSIRFVNSIPYFSDICISCRDDSLSSFGNQYKEAINSLLPLSRSSNYIREPESILNYYWDNSQALSHHALIISLDADLQAFPFIQQASLMQILKDFSGSIHRLFIVSNFTMTKKSLEPYVQNYIRNTNMDLRFFHIDSTDAIISGTPFEGVYSSYSQFPRLIRDMVGMALVWKFGGMYVDDLTYFSDNIHENFIHEVDSHLFSLSLPSHHPVLLFAMRTIARELKQPQLGQGVGIVAWLSMPTDILNGKDIKFINSRATELKKRDYLSLMKKLTVAFIEESKPSNTPLNQRLDVLRILKGANIAVVSESQENERTQRKLVNTSDSIDGLNKGYLVVSEAKDMKLKLKNLIDYGTVSEYILLLPSRTTMSSPSDVLHLLDLMERNVNHDMIVLSDGNSALRTYGSINRKCLCLSEDMEDGNIRLQRMHLTDRSAGILIRSSLLEAIVTGKDPLNPFLIDGLATGWLQQMYHRAYLIGAHVEYCATCVITSPNAWVIDVRSKHICVETAAATKSMDICPLQSTETKHKEVGTGKPFKLSAVTVILNEGSFLREWIEYHIMQGFDSFVFYDDGSSDNFEAKLSSYIVCRNSNCDAASEPYRPVIFIESVEGLKLKQVENGQIMTQTNCFSDALTRFGKLMNWMAFTDVDEFVVPIRDGERFIDMLDDDDHDAIGGVMLRTVLFGSNSIKRELSDKDLVTELFTRRFDWNAMDLPDYADFLRFRQGKTIVRPDVAITSNNAHEFRYQAGWQSVDDGLHPQWSISVFSSPSRFFLAHFKSKSLAHYKAKMEKAVVQGNTNKWNWFANTFEGVDRNDVQDLSLAKFSSELRKRLNSSGN